MAGPLPAIRRAQHHRAATGQQGFAIAIDERPRRRLGPPHHRVIAAVHATAAEVIGGEQVVVATLANQEGAFDGVRLFRPLDDGHQGFRIQRLAGRRVEPRHLQPAPEAAEDQPLPAIGIAHQIGIDGVVVVTGLRGDDQAFVLPAEIRPRRIQRRRGHQADDRTVLAEGRGGVIEAKPPAFVRDIRGPGAARPGYRSRHPVGKGRHDRTFQRPGDQVGRGPPGDQTLAVMHLASAEQVVEPAFADDARIMHRPDVALDGQSRGRPAASEGNGGDGRRDPQGGQFQAQIAACRHARLLRMVAPCLGQLTTGHPSLSNDRALSPSSGAPLALPS